MHTAHQVNISAFVISCAKSEYTYRFEGGATRIGLISENTVLKIFTWLESYQKHHAGKRPGLFAQISKSIFDDQCNFWIQPWLL